MLCKLTIGYQDYLLPSEKGVQTVLNVMSKAHRVYDHRCRAEGFEMCDNGLPVACQMEMLPTWRLRPGRGVKKPVVLEPEVLPPVRGALAGRSRQLPPRDFRALPEMRLELTGKAGA